ncbi:MAG TPA: sterol desaturase family protein [Oligoflexia bacterium]|nr:sterol desaturase family protein [Oligoflexia bacterium]
MVKNTIRYAAYPTVLGLSAMGVLMCIDKSMSPWPTFAVIAALALFVVACLERIQPYQAAWLENHQDLIPDIGHAIGSLGLLSLTAWVLSFARMDMKSVWPDSWSVGLQVLLAGAVIDLGLYAMHRLSHHIDWLWRLHALHHSSERLYWLNGERRHPLSAIVLASPGIAVTVALGAPPLVLSAWFALLTVHLAFQHANLDYSLGPFRYLFGVAEVHRWHHKREYEVAQVNFGEFWMIWDHLFGSFYYLPQSVQAGDVGLREGNFPTRYFAQLCWPFRT